MVRSMKASSGRVSPMPYRDKGSGGEFAPRVLWFSWRNLKLRLGLEAKGSTALLRGVEGLSPMAGPWKTRNWKTK